MSADILQETDSPSENTFLSLPCSYMKSRNGIPSNCHLLFESLPFRDMCLGFSPYSGVWELSRKRRHRTIMELPWATVRKTHGQNTEFLSHWSPGAPGHFDRHFICKCGFSVSIGSFVLIVFPTHHWSLLLTPCLHPLTPAHFLSLWSSLPHRTP